MLGPPKSFTSSNDNDQSVVIRIDCGESSFLFTGDATTRAERAIIATGADLDCDVLKAGHHGSSTSSSETFLDAVTPEIVLISAGKNNRYRHPHSETLDRFKAQHARILRTDQSGSIAIFTDGESMRIETVRRHK